MYFLSLRSYYYTLFYSRSLLAIPVDEGENTKTDTMFLEEGRRILMVGRYRVLQKTSGVSLILNFRKFTVCVLLKQICRRTSFSIIAGLKSVNCTKPVIIILDQ